MSEDFTKEKAQKYAENLFETDSSYSEILVLLLKKGFTQYQAEEIIKPIFKNKLKKVINRQKLISLILILVILTLVGLYLYGENRNNTLAEMEIAKGNGVLNKDGHIQ